MSFDPFGQEVSTEGMEPETVHDGGGNTVAAEGRFHVQTESVEIENKEGELPFVKTTMRVLNGEVESELNKVVYNRLYLANWEDKKNKVIGPLKEGAQKGLIAFLHSFGVIGDEAFGQTALRITRDMFERLEGTQAVIKVTKGKDRTVEKDGEKVTYAGRYEMQWSNDCWPIDHEKVKDVPKDHVLAAAATPAADDLDDI